MLIRIRIALSDDDKDRLFRARHARYVEAGGFMPRRADRRVHDRFDQFGPDKTVNFMAERNGVCVGGLRLVLRDELSTSADDMFDFTEFLGPEPAACTSMMFADVAVEGDGRLIPALTNIIHHYADAKGIVWTYGCVSPDAWPWVYKLGGRKLSEDVLVTRDGLQFVPYTHHRDEYCGVFLSYLERLKLGALFDVWDRLLATPGEILATAGAFCEHAVVVAEGEVDVVHPTGEVQRAGVGTLLGEEALLVGGSWPYAIRVPEYAEVLLIDQDALLTRVLAHPEAIRRLGALQMAAARAPVGAGKASDGAPVPGRNAPLRARAQAGSQRSHADPSARPAGDQHPGHGLDPSDTHP